MPEITNPQVVTFANTRIRPIADKLYSTYYHAKSVLGDYNVGDIGSKIDSAGAGNLISDGSEIDGRTRISGGDIYNIITALQEFIDYVEGGTVTTAERIDIIAKPHVSLF